MNLQESLGKWITVFHKDYLREVLRSLNTEYTSKLICPAPENVFKAFELCPYDSCKAIFIGMDPYPQKGVSTGILFGNRKDTTIISPSLATIRDACLSEDEKIDLTLENWCRQGILMINSALTVQQDCVGSHALLWRPFMRSFLKKYSTVEPGQIYVLFGRQAQSFKDCINSDLNYIIETEHPAYYARIRQPMPKAPFIQVNKLLIDKYGIPIKWGIS